LGAGSEFRGYMIPFSLVLEIFVFFNFWANPQKLENSQKIEILLSNYKYVA
jgi:hypothetical protein